ncbi:MAG: hypothetical protein QOJ86_451, partial [Bradyrhizobium sp.]|nr:hypothetical protein [Bradyrhizobium sp.]
MYTEKDSLLSAKIPVPYQALGAATLSQADSGRCRPGGAGLIKALRSEHDDLGADIDAAVQVDHVLIAHPDTARRDVGADGPWLVGAVDAIERGAEIHGASAERVLRAAFHVPRQVGTARQHFRRRRPGRPLLLGGNRLDARP